MISAVKNVKPTETQNKAITAPLAPLMILAGAGTGKTFTILHRVSEKIVSGEMKSEQVVLLTFTEKAARDLERKLEDLNIPEADAITVSTFHAFCIGLVKEFNPDIMNEKSLVEGGDHLFLMAQRVDELDSLSSPDFRTDPLKAIQYSFLPFFNRAREELYSPESLERKVLENDFQREEILTQFPGLSPKVEPDSIQAQFHDLIHVFERYQDWKAEKGWIDYGDMILDCWQMLNNHPDILAKVREKYRHFIIDEYQDNNFALNEIVRLILGENPSITVVGDQDQCIYSFRGANYYTIQDFHDTYLTDRPDKEVKLEENFRSTQEILDLANAVMTQDQNRTPKMLKSADGRTGPKPVWHVAENPVHAKIVLGIIQEYQLQGRQYGDIAVLCRTTAKVREVSQTLERIGIPVDSFVDRFFAVEAVRDILAWAEVITDGEYFGPAFGRILKSQKRKSPDLDLKDFRYIHSLEAFDQKIADLHSVGIESILETMKALRSKLKKQYTPTEIVWEILDRADLLAECRHDYRYVDRLNLINVGRVLILADQFHDRHPDSDFKDWLHYMRVLSMNSNEPAVQPQMKNNGNAVQVMTIHRSKGLEFPFVILPYLRSVSFPTNFRPSYLVDCLPESFYHWPRQPDVTPKMEHEAEERRILYVGITRAESELHLIGPERAGCKFLKEAIKADPNLVNRKEWIMENEQSEPMTDRSLIKDRLFVELSREITEGNYTYAKQVIEALEALDNGKSIPIDNPYADWISHAESPEENNEEVLHLSASAVETYLDCPLKYRLSRIDRIPQKRSQAQLEFGIIVHAVLNEFMAPDEPKSEERLLELLKQHWNEEAFEYKIRSEELYHQAEEMLLNYFNFVQTNPPNVQAREEAFNFYMEDVGIEINGKIDRVDLDSEGVRVVDYKTGRPDPNPKAGKNLQLALYIQAVRQGVVSGVPPEMGRAQLIYLRDLDTLMEPYQFSEEEINNNLENVKTAAAGIREADFHPDPNERKCGFCDYRDFLCPAWENK